MSRLDYQCCMVESSVAALAPVRKDPNIFIFAPAVFR